LYTACEPPSTRNSNAQIKIVAIAAQLKSNIRTRFIGDGHP
jgi:hypothetical protein